MRSTLQRNLDYYPSILLTHFAFISSLHDISFSIYPSSFTHRRIVFVVVPVVFFLDCRLSWVFQRSIYPQIHISPDIGPQECQVPGIKRS